MLLKITQGSMERKHLILSYLSKTQGSVTPEDLYLKMRLQKEKISISTLYRYLNILSERGEVIKSEDVRPSRFHINS